MNEIEKLKAYFNSKRAIFSKNYYYLIIDIADI